MDYRYVKAWVPLGFVAWSAWALYLVWRIWTTAGGWLALGVVGFALFSMAFFLLAAWETVRADGYDLEKYRAPDGASRWRVGVRVPVKPVKPEMTTRWIDQYTGTVGKVETTARRMDVGDGE